MLLKLAASPFNFIVELVSSTIRMNRDLQNTKLAAILSVSVRLIGNRLTEFFSVNRLTGNIPSQCQSLPVPLFCNENLSDNRQVFLRPLH